MTMTKSDEELRTELVGLRQSRKALDAKIRDRERELADRETNLDRDWKLLVGAASLVVASKDRISPTSLSGYLSETMPEAAKARHRNQLAALQAMGDAPMAGQ
jgi:hypothetical protein